MGWLTRSTVFGRPSRSGAAHRVHDAFEVGRTAQLLHAQGFEHSTHGTAADDAGTRRGCAQYHASGAMTAIHIVMQGAA